MRDSTLTMAPDSASKTVARVARDVVEDTLLRLGQLGGRTNRRALLSALEGARATLDRLERSDMRDADHLACFEGARASMAAAASAVEFAEWPDAARLVARLVAVERALERGRHAAIDAIVGGQGAALEAERARGASAQRGEGRHGVASGVAFRASLDAPTLLVLERPPLRTHVDQALPEPLGLDEDELDAPFARSEEDTLAAMLSDGDRSLPLLGVAVPAPIEPSKRLEVLVPLMEGDDASATGSSGELAQLRTAALAYLEDVGANGNLRRPGDDRAERFDWESTLGFERRMLASLDALRALAEPFHSVDAPASLRPGLDVLDEALRYGRESLTADPGRAFARTLVLASVAGEDAIRAAVLALKQSPRWTHRAQVEALALAPSPAVDEALVRLCEERDPALLRVALQALAARGTATLGAVAPLTEHLDEAVRIEAYRALGTTAERAASLAVLDDRLASEESDRAAAEAALALTLHGSASGLAFARARLVEDAEEPGTLPTPVRLGLMLLLGLAGDAADHLVLAATYSGANGEAIALGFHGHLALAERLHRALVAPGEPYRLGVSQRREAASALVRITGAPLLEVEGDRYAASVDVAAWTAWWSSFASGLDPATRHRWGRPHSALASLAELEGVSVPVGVRELAALEVAIALREAPIRTDALVATQRRGIGRARASLESRRAEGSLPVGSWSRGV
jgi:hypothetical protein